MHCKVRRYYALRIIQALYTAYKLLHAHDKFDKGAHTYVQNTHATRHEANKHVF